MSETTVQETSVDLPVDIPPRWANSLMKWALTTPGLQSTVGRGVALLTFVGRRTGREYTIPVSYERIDDKVTIITKRVRNWWRNFQSPRAVGLRLAGRDFTGTARIRTGDSEVLDFMSGFLARRPIDAKAYGLGKDELTRDKIRRIVPQIVVIDVDLVGPEVPAISEVSVTAAVE